MPENSFSLWRLWPDFSLIFSQDASSAEALSALVVGFLLVLLAIAIAYAVIKTHTAKQNIRFYESLLSTRSRDTMANDREEIRRAVHPHSQRRSVWYAFDESLIESPHNRCLFNAYGADYFFNTHSLSRGLTDNRLIGTMPGVLTAIGVIGTFAGLQMGLSSLQLNDVSHVEDIKSGIFTMIGGASIAFITSVWGLLTSLIFNVVEKSLERGVRSDIRRLQNTVDRLFPRVTAEQTLVSIEQQQQFQNAHFSELANNIGKEFEKALHRTSEQLQESLAQSFTTTLGRSMDSMVNKALQGFEQSIEQVQQKNVDTMQEAGASQQQLMASLGESQRQMLMDVAQAQQAVVKTIGESQRSLLSQVSDDLQKTMNGLENKFSDFVTHMEQHSLAMTDTSQNAISELAHSSQETLAALMSSSESSLESLSKTSHESISAMTQAIQQQFAEQNERDLDRRQALNAQFEDLSEQIREAAQAMQTSVTTVFDRTESLVTQNVEAHDHLQQLLGTLDVIAQRIEQSASSLKDAASTADNGFSAVHEGFEQLAESLKGHIGELNQQVANLLQDYSSQVEEQTVARLNVWNEQTSDYITAMTQAVKAVNTVVNEIEGKVGSAAA